MQSVRRAGKWPWAVVSAAGICLFWALTQARAERLRELPLEEFPIACRNGCVVTVGRSSNRLQGLPVTGGPGRTLTPTFGKVGTLRATFYTDLGVVIRSEEPEAPPPASTQSGGPSGVSPGPMRARLWSVALDGQAAHELLPELKMAQAVPAGDQCYWLRAGADARKTETSRGGARLPHFDLMVTPLRGGNSRTIALGLSSFVRLEPLGHGVSWSVPRPGTWRSDRYLALPPEYAVRVALECSGTPELLAGRLYWFDQGAGSAPGNPGSMRVKLVSAAESGDDRSELLELSGNATWEERGRLLGIHQGRLYALLYRRSAKPGALERPMLCEIRDNSIGEVASLRARIGSTWLESGCLYYTAEERRENWLDWTQAGLIPKRAQVLYRIQLPG